MVLMYIGEINKNVFDNYSLFAEVIGNIKRDDPILIKLANPNLVIDVDKFYIDNDLFLLDMDDVYSQDYKLHIPYLITKYSKIVYDVYLKTFIKIIGLELFMSIVLEENWENNFLSFSLSCLRVTNKLIPSLKVKLAMIDFSYHKNVNEIMREYGDRHCTKNNYNLVHRLASILFIKTSEKTFKVNDRLVASKFISSVHDYIHVFMVDNIIQINNY